jgi:tetratricopeptide (TPR) repeat protein
MPIYYNLSINQMHAGDIQAARDTCDRAIAQGLDGEQIRNTYFKIAYLLGDTALVKVQRDWFAAHPDPFYHILAEGYVAIAGGRLADAHQLETGDLAAAHAGLLRMQQVHPHDTLWNLVWSPIVGAGIATADHRPADAAAQFANSHLIESRDLDLSARRGNAYLAAGKSNLAEKSFRFILEHQYIDPIAVEYPLAWLGLGRALSGEGNVGGAKEAYQHFLNLWVHADTNAVLLQQARREFADLH